MDKNGQEFDIDSVEYGTVAELADIYDIDGNVITEGRGGSFAAADEPEGVGVINGGGKRDGSAAAKRRMRRTRVRMESTAFLMILPFFGLFFVFTLLPVLVSVPISLTEFDMVHTPRFVGLENFYNMFMKDSVFLISLQNTIVFALITGPVTYVMCFLLAWLIHQLPRVLASVFTFAFYAPALCGSIYATWALIFNDDSYGVLNSFLFNLGAVSAPVRWLSDPDVVMATIVVVQLWMSVGTGFLALKAGLSGVPKERYEAGAIEGISGRGQELIYITLPAMGPQLLFAAVVQIAASFAAGDIGRRLTDFPTIGYSAHTLMSHAYDYGNLRFEIGYAAAVCVVMFAIMMFVNYVIRRLLLKYCD